MNRSGKAIHIRQPLLSLCSEDDQTGTDFLAPSNLTHDMWPPDCVALIFPARPDLWLTRLPDLGLLMPVPVRHEGDTIKSGIRFGSPADKP